MKTPMMAARVLLALTLACAALLTFLPHELVAGVAGAVLTAGFSFPVIPKSVGELEAQANPSGDGLSEAIPYILYDTETYTDTVTTEILFFSTVKQDRSLSNMQLAGTLPQPQYFEVFYHGIDPIIPISSSATGLTGAWRDMDLLMFDGRPTITFEMSDKKYGPMPASFFHSSGGVTGAAYNEAAAGAVKAELANNGIFDGGFCWNGAITISPSNSFTVRMSWPAAVNTAADRKIRCWLAGVLHRKVL